MAIADVNRTIIGIVNEVERKLGVSPTTSVPSTTRLGTVLVDFQNDVMDEVADYGDWPALQKSVVVTAVASTTASAGCCTGAWATGSATSSATTTSATAWVGGWRRGLGAGSIFEDRAHRGRQRLDARFQGVCLLPQQGGFGEVGVILPGHPRQHVRLFGQNPLFRNLQFLGALVIQLVAVLGDRNPDLLVGAPGPLRAAQQLFRQAFPGLLEVFLVCFQILAPVVLQFLETLFQRRAPDLRALRTRFQFGFHLRQGGAEALFELDDAQAQLIGVFRTHGRKYLYWSAWPY